LNKKRNYPFFCVRKARKSKVTDDFIQKSDHIFHPNIFPPKNSDDSLRLEFLSIGVFGRSPSKINVLKKITEKRRSDFSFFPEIVKNRCRKIKHLHFLKIDK